MALAITVDIYQLGVGNKVVKKYPATLMTSRIRSVSGIPLGYSPDPAVFIYSKINYAEAMSEDLYTGETVAALTTRINA